jgi:hypothetical protein
MQPQPDAERREIVRFEYTVPQTGSSEDWNRPEEDEAWSHLQRVR